MIKLLAYKYPTSADIEMQRTVKPMHFSLLKDNVQNTIKQLLFVNKYHYLLVGLNGKMFICEPVNFKNKEYSRREISYHPFSDMLK